jgi:hypothetical protein
VLSSTAVVGSHEFGLCLRLGAQGGSQISTGGENIAGGSAVLLTLSKGLEIKLSDFEAKNATLKGDYLWRGVEIVFGGVPTIIGIRIIWLFMSLGSILLQVSISMNLVDQMKHQVDARKVEVGIELLATIYLVGDIIPAEVHIAPLLGQRPRFSICFLVYRWVLHAF